MIIYFQDNSTTLLRHIVHVNTKESEGTDAGKNEASWRFPDVAIMTQASNISFKDVTAELNLLKTQIRSHSRKVFMKICLAFEFLGNFFLISGQCTQLILI